MCLDHIYPFSLQSPQDPQSHLPPNFISSCLAASCHLLIMYACMYVSIYPSVHPTQSNQCCSHVRGAWGTWGVCISEGHSNHSTKVANWFYLYWYRVRLFPTSRVKLKHKLNYFNCFKSNKISLMELKLRILETLRCSQGKSQDKGERKTKWRKGRMVGDCEELNTNVRFDF